MKNLVSLLSLVLLCSCTNSIYHVSSLQSEQVQVVGKDFVFENEHLKVIYNFWEKGGRMRFLLFNKTDQPLYIDWSKSALSHNGVKTLYTQLPTLPKRRATDSFQYAYRDTILIPFEATARANRLARIPARTYVAIADFPIQQVVLHKETREKSFAFTKENSPLQVGQQLAYSFDESLTNTSLIDHSFWIDKIQVLRTGELNKSYGPLDKGQPNALYAVEQRVATGRVIVITLAATTGGVLVIMNMIQQFFNSIPFCC